MSRCYVETLFQHPTREHGATGPEVRNELQVRRDRNTPCDLLNEYSQAMSRVCKDTHPVLGVGRPRRARSSECLDGELTKPTAWWNRSGLAERSRPRARNEAVELVPGSVGWLLNVGCGSAGQALPDGRSGSAKTDLGDTEVELGCDYNRYRQSRD